MMAFTLFLIIARLVPVFFYSWSCGSILPVFMLNISVVSELNRIRSFKMLFEVILLALLALKICAFLEKLVLLYDSSIFVLLQLK